MASTTFIEQAPQQTVAFHTLGCKTNQLETSAMADEFRAQGWAVVPFDEPATLYVLNTCTVTERSDLESLRMIRRARLSNPQARIAATGCFAQVAPQVLSEAMNQLGGINYVIGNNFKDQIFRITQEAPPPSQALVQVSDIDKSRIMVGASASAINRTRGSLKIQDGCDYKCTYCIIWEARGLSRSLPVEDLKLQLSRMLAEGYQEVMLTGINIGQYEHDGADLSDLLAELITLPGTFRLRLSSLDPLEVTDKLIATVAGSGGKIAPHFHLSAQSAEDGVLKRMARRHHVADFVRICEAIDRQLPNAQIGSDIIVGFPGESDAQFEATYQTLKETPIHYFHVFSYSRRKGTPAATFPDQVPERVKKERATRLKTLSDEKNLAFRQGFIGNTLAVIVEEGLEKGVSENYIRVQLDANGFNLNANDLVTARLLSLDGEESHGRVEAVLASPPSYLQAG